MTSVVNHDGVTVGAWKLDSGKVWVRFTGNMDTFLASVTLSRVEAEALVRQVKAALK